VDILGDEDFGQQEILTEIKTKQKKDDDKKTMTAIEHK
jgi:hypothetical protein